MFTVSLFGAGKIGEAICGLLSRSGRYKIRVCDYNIDSAKKICSLWQNCDPFLLDLNDNSSVAALLTGSQAVISALPFHCNVGVAEIAAKCGVHYFDLTEDVETTKAVSRAAQAGTSFFMPQCGLAPGFISIAAMHLVKAFDQIDAVKMRVGALPIYPSNRLKYCLTWSTEGLINEYGNMCEVVDNGHKRLAFPLEGYEHFSLDGIEYEAFNTSGGLGTLCETLQGKVQSLNYKSVRYPGHCELIKFLMHDLRFDHDRENLRKVFERSISTTNQDKCLILVEVSGVSKGRFMQRTYASTVYNRVLEGKHFSAIQLTTAAGVCAPLDMFLTGQVKCKNRVICAEDISLVDFLNNEFGKHYRDEKALEGILI